MTEHLTKHPGEVMNIRELLQEEGRKEERVEIAKRLFKDGMPLELIHQTTTLSIETLQQLLIREKTTETQRPTT